MFAPVWFGGLQCLDPVALRRSCLEASPPLPTDWWGRANRWDNRSGHLSGTGGVIMLRRDLLKLDLNTTHDLTMLDHFGEKVVHKELHVAGDTVCLNPSSPDNENTAHFVPLADNRRLWKLTSINAGFNLRVTPNGDYATSTATDESTPYTATEIKADLWARLTSPTAGDVPDFPGTPAEPVDNLAYWGWNVPEAIGHFLSRCAYAWVWDSLEDEHTIVELGADQDGLDAEFRRLQADGKRIFDIEPMGTSLGTVPSTIDVYFLKSPGPRAYGESPYFVVSVNAPAREDGESTDGESGTLVLYDDLLAQYQASELQNEADLNTKAAARAEPFWQARRNWFDASMRRTYSGYLDTIIPGSQVQSVSWLDVGYGPQTIVELWPARDPVADWEHTGHQPWRDIEWVLVDSVESGSGSGIAPDGYSSGQVTRLNAESSEWELMFDCWWRGGNDETPVSGNRYESTFEGYKENDSGELRPVYVGTTGGGSSDESFLALLVAKCYKAQTGGPEGTAAEYCEPNPDEVCAVNRYILYSWVRVVESGDPDGDPCSLTYEFYSGAGRSCGGPQEDCWPAYHVQNMDLPVWMGGSDGGCCVEESGSGTWLSGSGAGDLSIAIHSIVRLRLGSGNYYLIEHEPWTDIWRRTGENDADGYEKIYLRYFDQNTGTWEDGEEGRLIESE